MYANGLIYNIQILPENKNYFFSDHKRAQAYLSYQKVLFFSALIFISTQWKANYKPLLPKPFCFSQKT